MDVDSDDEQPDEGECLHILQAIQLAHGSLLQSAQALVLFKAQRRDHCTHPRKKKRKFDHKRALDCIRADLTGSDATFIGKDFKAYFCVKIAISSTFWKHLATMGEPFTLGNWTV
jgi:hypothetical protein